MGETEKDQLQARYEALEKEKAQYADDSFRMKQIEVEQKDISTRLKELEQQETKAAVIEQIQLPQDYDALTGFPGLNGEIQTLIEQALDQIQQIHAAELEQVHNDHKAAIDQMQTAIAELTDRNMKLQQIYDAEQAAHAITKTKLLEEQEARRDAEQKRDNAVALAEDSTRLKAENDSLKSQVNELESMLTRQKPKPVVGGLTFTSTIKPETDEERSVRLERERIDMINRSLERRGLEPLKLPDLPNLKPAESVTSQQLEDAFQSAPGDEEVARGDAGGTGVSEAPAALDGAGDAPAGPTLSELAVRVAELERVVFGKPGQVA